MTVTMPGSPVSHAVRVEDVPDPQVSERAKRRTYTAKYKAAILAEYEAADRDGRGALMRREGLYSLLLSEWRKQRDKGALEGLCCVGRSSGIVERSPARVQMASVSSSKTTWTRWWTCASVAIS